MKCFPTYFTYSTIKFQLDPTITRIPSSNTLTHTYECFSHIDIYLLENFVHPWKSCNKQTYGFSIITETLKPFIVRWKIFLKKKEKKLFYCGIKFRPWKHPFLWITKKKEGNETTTTQHMRHIDYINNKFLVIKLLHTHTYVTYCTTFIIQK